MKKPSTLPNYLLESIRIHDGVPDLLPYHQQRVNRSRKALFPKSPALKLAPFLETLSFPTKGTYKLRLEYGREVDKHELVPYQMKPVERIKLVVADQVKYGKKYVDRSAIHKLLERRGHCDDILMVQRGHLTDTSYANIALFDGRHWYTPAWPMLRGTRREQLIQTGVLRPSVIRERDLHNFRKLRLINAMLPWETGPEIAIEAIVPQS